MSSVQVSYIRKYNKCMSIINQSLLKCTVHCSSRESVLRNHGSHLLMCFTRGTFDRVIPSKTSSGNRLPSLPIDPYTLILPINTTFLILFLILLCLLVPCLLSPCLSSSSKLHNLTQTFKEATISHFLISFINMPLTFLYIGNT